MKINFKAIAIYLMFVTGWKIQLSESPSHKTYVKVVSDNSHNQKFQSHSPFAMFERMSGSYRTYHVVENVIGISPDQVRLAGRFGYCNNAIRN